MRKKNLPSLIALLVVAAFISLVVIIEKKYGTAEGGAEMFGIALFVGCIIGWITYEGVKSIQDHQRNHKFKKDSATKRIKLIDYAIIFIFIVVVVVVIQNTQNLFILDDLSEGEQRANMWIFSTLCSLPAVAMFTYGKLLKNTKVHIIWQIIFTLSCIACGVFETFQNVGFWNHTDTSHWVMTGTHTTDAGGNLLWTLIVTPFVTAGFSALIGIIIYGIIKSFVRKKV